MARRKITEGKAIIEVPSEKKVAKSLDYFYNPRMELNRTISLEVIKTFGKEKMQIALPLAASGIRGVRILKELPKKSIKRVDFNDHNPKAIRAIKKNLALNKLKSKFTVSKKDADLFLLEGSGWNYIDIDPFGSPNFLLDSAMKRIARNGILAVTATDTAALAGTYPTTCMRKYNAHPVRNHIKHEIATRILIRKVQIIGSQYDRACIPIVSYAKEHYLRIFFKCVKSKSKAESLLSQHGLLGFCDKHGIITKQCCNTEIAGPLWLGSLFDNQVAKMDQEIPLITQMKQELDIPGCYDIHALSKKDIAKTSIIMKRLMKKGYHTSRTLFNKYGLKTDAPFTVVKRILNR